MFRSLILSIFLCAPAMPASAQDALRVGVFGVVDSISPLVVAGQEIDRPEGLAVLSPLGPGQQIAVGDTLAVRAVLAGDRLHAERLLEVYAAAGPVTQVSEGEAYLMGTAVHLPGGAAVREGDWIALSGLWSGAKVITTALRRTDVGGLAQLTGVFDLPEEIGPPSVGGSAIFGADLPQGDFDDDVWMLTGAPEGEGLRVFLMSKGLFGGPVDLELWEGHASGPVASETWMIFGTGVYGYDREADMPVAGALVRVCARAGRVLRRPPERADLAAAMKVLDCG